MSLMMILSSRCGSKLLDLLLNLKDVLPLSHVASSIQGQTWATNWHLPSQSRSHLGHIGVLRGLFESLKCLDGSANCSEWWCERGVKESIYLSTSSVPERFAYLFM